MDLNQPFPEPRDRVEAETNRRHAELQGAHRYIGRPCYRCQGRVRYIAKNRCVPCHAADSRRQRERRRQANGQRV